MPYIYILKNKINSKCYVGQTTKTVQGRIKDHLKTDSRVGNALRKYGLESFDKYIFYVPKNWLDYFETEMIKKLKTIKPYGYNIESGGNKLKELHEETKIKIGNKNRGRKRPIEAIIKSANSNIGKKRTEETRIKLSEASKGNKSNLGRHFSEEHKLKLSISNANTNKGKKLSQEHKEKLSASHKGRIPWNKGKEHTEEAKKKISESLKEKYLSNKEYKEKISNSLIGNKHTLGHKLSEEHKKKVSEALKGRKHSEESKKKMSESKKGKKRGPYKKRILYNENKIEEGNIDVA